jgi:eukaryotic-like serine/threonine-protein kinase
MNPTLDPQNAAPSDRWLEIDRLFHAAAALPPEDRARFLDAECKGDVDLRSRLDALLMADAVAQPLLSDIVMREGASLAECIAHPLEGTRLGPYEIIRVIGRGGMGEVFLARRADREFDKQVAIKLMSAGLDTGARRFMQERQILARLEHPNIARLLDGGTTSDHRPYLVMEYIEGVPITEYRAAENFSANLYVEQCCRLFLQVCAAVEYAHRNLIVHRDIKPGNILVDASGTPKLLDFGIAKLVEDEGSPGDATATVARALTPHYASPEQISGAPVTTATDIYMLGEVLFELLTGARAHQLSSTAPGELERVICRTAVEKPSIVNPGLRRKLAGDLDNIVLRALDKDPERRYPSVEKFGTDVRRYLDGRPVSARPNTLGYRFGKALRRHPATASIVALLILSIAAGVASTVREQRRTERRFAEVRQLVNVFLFDFENAIRKIPGTADARQLVIRTGVEYLDRLSREAGGNPSLQRELAAAYVKMGELQSASSFTSVSVRTNVAAAAESYRHAIDLLRSIGAPRSADPSLRHAYISAFSDLADVESDSDLTASLRDKQEAVRLSEALAAARPGDREALELQAGTMSSLAQTQQRSDLAAAVANARKALAIREELARRFPEPAAQAGLAGVHMRLSMMYTDLRDWPAVAREGASAVEIMESLHASAPSDLSLAKRLMIAYIQLGKGLYGSADRAQKEEGIAYLRKSVDLADEIHSTDPDSTDALTDVTGIHSVYGDRLARIGDPSAAQPYLARAAHAAETLAMRDPGNRNIRSTWGIDLTFVARNQERLHDLAGAIRIRQQVEGIFRDLLQASPSDIRVLTLAAENWDALGELYLDTADAASARRYSGQAAQTVEDMRKKFPVEALPVATLDEIVRRVEAVRSRLK